jgi:alkanesulfonate monooxygenase SsuD/methylene tetrahydromethanopterin reductase-like flavin-dependent oxidoreductase (luciferase family)
MAIPDDERRELRGGAPVRHPPLGPALRCSLRHVVQRADWGAIGHLADLHAREGRPPADPQRRVHSAENPLARRALARRSSCAVGDPDAIAREFARLRTAGLDGLAVNFVDYLRELPYFAAEVLPRLERLGLRRAARVSG